MSVRGSYLWVYKGFFERENSPIATKLTGRTHSADPSVSGAGGHRIVAFSEGDSPDEWRSDV